tara:strand:- start:3217 stop:5301 length:2085 start_codon:yes stop_codon:yes gene_type:complete
MGWDRQTRGLSQSKLGRPNIKQNLPLPKDGDNGDMSIRNVTAGVFSFFKALGTWFKLFNDKNHMIPDKPNTYDIGSQHRPWRSLYLSNNTLHMGNTKAEKTSISTDGTDLKFKNKAGTESKVVGKRANADTGASVDNTITLGKNTVSNAQGMIVLGTGGSDFGGVIRPTVDSTGATQGLRVLNTGTSGSTMGVVLSAKAAVQASGANTGVQLCIYGGASGGAVTLMTDADADVPSGIANNGTLYSGASQLPWWKAGTGTEYQLLTTASGGATYLPLAGGALTGDITITDTTAPQLTLINTSGEQASFSVSGTGSLDIDTIGDGTTDSDITLDADGKIILDSATNLVRIVSSITMPLIAEGSLTSPDANSAQIWFDSDRAPYYRYRPGGGAAVGPAKPILVEVKNDLSPELGSHLFSKTWSINLGLKNIATIQDEWRFITNDDCDYDNGTAVTCATDVNIVVGMSVTGSESDPTDIPADNFITAITESGGAGTGTTSFELNVATQNGAKTRQTLTFGDIGRTGSGINILHSGDAHASAGDKSLVMSDWDESGEFVTNGYYVGDFLDGQNTNGLTVGQIITINGASWETVNASTGVTATQWLGVCAVAHASKGVVLIKGFIRVAASEIVFSDEITSGTPMYISSGTAGHWTDLAPTTGGHIVRYAGHAVWGSENADEIEDEDTLMYFNPSRTWMEL